MTCVRFPLWGGSGGGINATGFVDSSRIAAISSDQIICAQRLEIFPDLQALLNFLLALRRIAQFQPNKSAATQHQGAIAYAYEFGMSDELTRIA